MGQVISLNGEWEYSGRDHGTMQIPGVIEQCAAERDYYGEFRLKRGFSVPEKKEDQRFLLRFHGVSYTCTVYCNGKQAISHEGVWDAFAGDVTELIREGQNEIEVVLRKPDFDKKSPYFFRSVLFGFIPDIMLPFGGIWKDVELEVKNEIYFKDLKTVFRTEEEQIIITSDLCDGQNDTDILSTEVELTMLDGKRQIFTYPYSGKICCRLDHAEIWEPDAPAVYRGKVRLLRNGDTVDEKGFSGGFRKIRIENGEILINDKPFYMRGILHWGCYPEKMCPCPSYEEVRSELLKIREMGFNTVKHCLYFPPDYYYELCDEMGIVTWQELPLWLPADNGFIMDRIFSQYPAMLEIFRNHPSVVMASLGCELDGTIDSETLNKLYFMLKESMPEVIVCDNSGSGECFDGETDSESDIYDYHFYAELYNLNELLHEFTAGYRKKKPWLFGEFNDADTFRLNRDGKAKWWRDPDESKNLLRKVHKGFGSDQPVYYQDEILKKYEVSDEVTDLEYLSKEQMKDIRKFILETTRSFPEVKGYNITAIRDVPITSSGIFDDDMEAKADPEWMNRVNGDIVVSFQKDLARKWESGSDHFLNQDRFNYLAGEGLKGRFVLSNRSARDLEGNYRITVEDGAQVLGVSEGNVSVSAAGTVEMGQPRIFMPSVEEARRLTLRAELEWEEGTYENSWSIWVYPKKVPEQSVFIFDQRGVLNGAEEIFTVERVNEYEELRTLESGAILVTSVWGEEIRKAVARGVKVIALISEGAGISAVKVPFFREGITRITDHPAMSGIAHRGYAGIQFFGVAGDSALDRLSLMREHPDYKSLMRRYDARNFSVAEYAVEYTEGEGRVLMSTLNFCGGCGEQPSGFTQNKLAVKLLCDWITYLEGEQI